MRTGYKPRKLRTVAAASALAFALCAHGATDDFLEQSLASAWSVESPGQAEHIVEDGRLRVDVPGRHFLAWFDEGATAPLFLVAPPADTQTIAFDTHLRFLRGGRVPVGATAGLILTRRDSDAGVLFEAYRGWRRLGGAWWSGEGFIAGLGLPAFIDGEDIWLRFEHLGDHFVFSRKAFEDDPWEDVTEDMPDNLSNIAHRFPPGAFLVGLFVTSGLAHDDDVAVEFDYFSSPEIPALDVQAPGKAATAWGILKDSVR